MIARLDHLVYATPDVDATVEDLTALLGVRAANGGRHEGRGTRNALIALGPRSYLEIVGPDLSQPPPNAPRWFGIDALERPRLVTWAANATDLPRLVSPGSPAAALLGAVAPGSRRRPDGATLHWSFTDPTRLPQDGLVPFLIEWGSSPHPAESAPSGIALVALRAEHPDPPGVGDALSALNLRLDVALGAAPMLIATLRAPTGMVDLR